MHTRLFTMFAVVGAFTFVGSDVHAKWRFEAKALSKRKQAKVDSEPLGSAKNPIRCESPAGQRAYLARLRCKSGQPPTHSGRGSAGPGPYGTMMDQYTLTCPSVETTTAIFMDMYHHAYTEKRPIPGFAIEGPPPPGEDGNGGGL